MLAGTRENRAHQLLRKACVMAGFFLVCWFVAFNVSLLAAPQGAVVKPPALPRPAPNTVRPTGAVKATTVVSNKATVVSSNATAAPVQTKAKPKAAPKLSAAAAVLMDVGTGKVLYSVQPHARRAPASLTKLVTAIVTIQQGKMNSVAKVSANAAAEPPSRLGLKAGDRIRLSKLLEAALMGSSNDAATAIAEHIAGSESAFAKRMNDTARKIGAKESNFRNAHGLDSSGHYSTAYDMALISRYALQQSTLARVFTQQHVDLTWEGGSAKVENINSFLWRYKGAIGLKTGYTDNAGYSVSAAAKQGSRSLLVVLLGCPTSEARWSDAVRLMDYGFQEYGALVAAATAKKTTYVVKKGDTLSGIAARFGKRVADIVKTNASLAQQPDRIIPGQVLVIP